jgi:anti-sigma factor RsiW
MAGVTPDPSERDELFSAYLDGELTPDEVALVSEILEADEDAIASFHEIRTVRMRLRVLPEFEVPAALLPDGHLGDRLSAYLDGELVTMEYRRVTRHLVDCSDCRMELQELDRARIAIRSLPGVDTGLTDQIPVIPTRKKRRRYVAGGIGAAAAAALILGITMTGGNQATFTLEDLSTRHVARASAEPAFAILPAMVEVSAP